MGRHTRKRQRRVRASAEDDRVVRGRWLGKMPLLPAVAGVLAIGAIISAVSTKQISLNFAGGTPPIVPSPPAADVTPSGAGYGPHGVRDGSSLSARGRASRGAARSVVTVAFHRTSATATGFSGAATISNHGSRTINGWTLTFRYPDAKIVRVSGGTVLSTGTTSVVGNPANHPSIAPGERVTLSFSARGTGAVPSACTFNGMAC